MSLYNDKGSIHQEDITFVNIYAPDIGTSKYLKQILTDGRNREQYSNIRGFQYSPIHNEEIIQTEK